MLNVLRDSFQQRPYLKWVLLMVAASFVLYLGNLFECGQGRMNDDRWAARVNGEDIPSPVFLDTAARMDEYYRNLLGERYDQMREQLQIRNQALAGLVDEKLVQQDARRMGLRVSKREIAERIRSDPRLQDGSGQFIGTDRYLEMFDGQPGGAAAFEQELADRLLVQKWTTLVTQPVAIGDEELKELFRKRVEKTAVRYVVVASADQDVDTNVSPEDERRWYDEHADRYRRGEGRRIRYVVLERDAAKSKVQIGEADVRAAYEANLDSYRHPEQRRARHILFRVEPQASAEEKARLRQEAERTLARLAAGEDFAALARTLSTDPDSAERGGDLGFFGRGQMVAPFEQAAFATAVGQRAPVVESDFGFHVLEVTDLREAGTVPLAEVEPEIRRTLELQRAQDWAQSEAQRLAAEIPTADRLQPIAEREGLTVQSRVVVAREPLGDLGAGADFLEQVFTLAPGAVSRPLRVASGVALVAVDEPVPAAVAPLDEIRGRLRADVLNERVRDRALARATSALNEHQDVPRAARALGLEVLESGDIAAGEALPKTGGFTPELQVRLFGSTVAVGDRGAAAVPAGAVVYEVTGRTPFDAERFEQEKATLRQEVLGQRRDAYRQAVLDQLRAKQEIEYNNAWLQGGARS